MHSIYSSRTGTLSMITKKILASACILLFCQPVLAMTLTKEQYVCPIGGEAFTQVVPGSGTSFGMRTDFMAIGPIASPWTIPQCPTNKFVMFKDDFTPKELQTYKKIIESAEYKAIAEDSSEYYYLAKLLEGNDENDEDIAWAYLRASWEMSDDESQKKALNFFKRSLMVDNLAILEDTDRDNRIKSTLLVGELTRLSGNFAAAKKHFEKLKRDETYTKNPRILSYINFELKLIAQGNSNPEALE